MTKPKSYPAKRESQALRMFGHDLLSIREGYQGGHFSAESAAAEFRAACVEVERRLVAVESLEVAS